MEGHPTCVGAVDGRLSHCGHAGTAGAAGDITPVEYDISEEPLVPPHQGAGQQAGRVLRG